MTSSESEARLLARLRYRGETSDLTVIHGQSVGADIRGAVRHITAQDATIARLTAELAAVSARAMEMTALSMALAAAPSEAPSYHDLHITTPDIPRTSIMDLPFRVRVSCSRVAGWIAWALAEDGNERKFLGGEYDDTWLVLDVAGHVICNSRDRAKPEGGE